VEWRKKARLLDSGGNSSPIRPLATTDSVIKPPKANPNNSTPSSKAKEHIPMQYSAQNTTIDDAENANDDSDEDPMTHLDYIINMTQQTNLSNPHYNTYMMRTANVSGEHNEEYVASLHYFSMLAKYECAMCISDGGADSHVGGKGWLPITPTSGPGVKHAELVGFDKDSARKSNLPIVSAITKATTDSGKTVILRAPHMVYNKDSPHTLLSEYEMRETGLIVDTVAKHHLADTDGNYGTQSIIFDDGEIISLSKKATLMTFAAEQPTMEEYETHPIYDIGILDWCPQDHYDDNSLNVKPRIQPKQIMNAKVDNEHDDNDSIYDDLPGLQDRIEKDYDSDSDDEENEIVDKEILEEKDNEVTPINTDTFLQNKVEQEEMQDSGELQEDDEFYDAVSDQQPDDDELYFFDALDEIENPKPGKVMHLSIDYQTIGKGEKGR
ncbi:MAG: hypothetical protein GY822_11165, partial [Deltaproteobacteria bacterium]|nr:hypothetical protein [Deltaproteobacteria bacterium]